MGKWHEGFQQELLIMRSKPPGERTPGEVAYDAFVSGVPSAAWADLPARLRETWEIAALTVLIESETIQAMERDKPKSSGKRETKG